MTVDEIKRLADLEEARLDLIFNRSIWHLILDDGEIRTKKIGFDKYSNTVYDQNHPFSKSYYVGLNAFKNIDDAIQAATTIFQGQIDALQTKIAQLNKLKGKLEKRK